MVIHSGINSFTQNEIYIGDKQDGYKYIYAHNSDTNLPNLRWNDSDNQWEFSNDGTTWNAISSTTIDNSIVDYITCGLEGTLDGYDGYFLRNLSTTEDEEMVSYVINTNYATLQNLRVT